MDDYVTIQQCDKKHDAMMAELHEIRILLNPKIEMVIENNQWIENHKADHQQSVDKNWKLITICTNAMWAIVSAGISIISMLKR